MKGKTFKFMGIKVEATAKVVKLYKAYLNSQKAIKHNQSRISSEQKKLKKLEARLARLRQTIVSLVVNK